MDLVVGSVHYVEEISFEDGWIHHLLYITICYFLLHHEMTAFFAVALIEEIPVVLLSFFEVRNKQRPSLLFGVLYFLTRVVFHTVLIYKVGQFFALCFVLGNGLAHVARESFPKVGARVSHALRVQETDEIQT